MPALPPLPQRRASKTILLVIFFGFLACVLGFMGLVGYYLWQLKYGDPVALKRSVYQGQLSIDASRQSSRTILTEPMSTYIRTHNPTLGSPNAPITIVAFVDFECPYSQRSYPIFEKVTQEFGPAVRIVFKHFPITAIHPQGNQAALAAACANEQGKFWEYYRRLFETKQLDTKSLEESARVIGLRMQTFSSCLASAKYQKNIDDDFQDVISVGVRGTPTYFINQTKIEGAVDFSVWQELIVKELQAQTKR